MTMPEQIGRGSKVDKLPVLPWCDRAVWGTLSSWKSELAAAVTIDTGTTLVTRCLANVPELRRFLLVESWFTDEVVGSKDIIHVQFEAKGIRPNCFVAPAEDWLTDNFPQEPVRLDGKDWMILSDDDIAIATLANPRLGQTASPADAAAFYAPYIPLQMKVANPAHKPVVFRTRYGLQE